MAPVSSTAPGTRASRSYADVLLKKQTRENVETAVIPEPEVTKAVEEKAKPEARSRLPGVQVVITKMQLLACSPVDMPHNYSPRCSVGWVRAGPAVLTGDSLPADLPVTPAPTPILSFKPPPGLSLLPGLCLPTNPLEEIWSSFIVVESDHPQRPATTSDVYHVLLAGVPEAMTHELMLRPVLDQANLEEGVVSFSTRPGGKVLLAFDSFDWVQPCILHFNRCHWAGSQKSNIHARYVYPVDAAEDAATESPAVELKKQRTLSAEAPVFAPSASMLSATARVFAPSMLSGNAPVFAPSASMLSADAAVFSPSRMRVLSASAHVFVPSFAPAEKSVDKWGRSRFCSDAI